MKQRGFHDFSGVGVVMIGMIIGASIGIGLAYLAQWLWSFVNPLIHQLTA